MSAGARPLTAYQRDIWSASVQAPNSPQFNCVLHEQLHGAIDTDRLVACAERALNRCETLRLRFGENAGVPVQWTDPARITVNRFDLSRESAPDAACTTWMDSSLRRVLPIQPGPLLEATVLVESRDVTHLHIKAHHIVADGWTLDQLGREILNDYGQEASGGREAAVREPLSYLEFVEEEAAYRTSAAAEAARAFHREYLLDAVPALFARGARRDERVRGRHSFLIDRALAERVRALGFFPLTYIATMLGTYLARIHRSEEATVGIPFLNRPTSRHKNTPGQFANTLPLRIAMPGSRTVREALAETQSAVFGLQRHQRLSLGDALRTLPASAQGPRQLFDVTLSYIHWPRRDRIPGVERQTALKAPCHDQDALSVMVYAFDDAADLRVDLDYACDVFDEDLPITAVAGHLKTLLEHGLDMADRPLHDVPMLTSAQHRDLTTGRAAGPRVPYPRHATLHGLFEAQAARRPERTAVIGAAGETLTYGELDAQANRIARALRATGVGPDDRVAVMMERGPRLAAVLLGALKAGGAYVPIDPGYPAERIDFLLRDSGAGVVVIDDDAHAPRPAGTAVRRVGELLHEADDGPLEPLATSRDLAYVIYTSGSTGRPKGVMVEHHSVVNRLAWMQRHCALGEEDVLLQKTPISFDVSVWELFWWAVVGAAVAMLPPGAHKDPREILRAIREHRVTAVHFVPSMLGPFLSLLEESRTARQDIRTLRYVFSSGEALPAAHVERFNRVAERARHEGDAGRSARLVNLYGPTEATVDVSFYDCPAGSGGRVARVPIGRPIDNTRLYVLDPHDRPQPVGVAGELCIGGVGVARGYLGRPELTAERFVPDPFAPGGRLYRTGDLARWLADGTLEYLGRIDGQVKIRGHRVEPDEVAAALRVVPGVRDAVVVDRPGPDGSTVLAGYYVADARLDTTLLREHLGRTLPAFMIPTTFTRIETVPLTPNGKADRGALPSPQEAAKPSLGGQPSNRVEAVLAEVWGRLLGHDAVGVHDDFFALGGDSILMLTVRAEAEARGLRFSLTDLFRHPTVAGLAPHVEWADTTEDQALEEAFALLADADRAQLAHAEAAEDAFPLTRLQLALLYHSRRSETSAVYKDVFRYTLAMAWDEERFRGAFDRLVARHPALRSTFDLAGFSEPLQVVRPRMHGGLDVVDLRSLDSASADAEVRAHIEERRRHPYTLDQAPLYLFRAHVRPATVDLVLSFHHALLDGGSVATLLRELLQDYAHALGLDTDPVGDGAPPPSAAAYVQLERVALRSPQSARYWRARLTGGEPPQIEAFGPHRPATGHKRASRRIEVPTALAARVRHLAAEHSLPVKSVLFAAHSLVLAALAGTRDVTTGLITHGRPELAGAERIAGLFLNTVPARLDTAQESWLEVAREALRQERDGHPHRRYPLSAIQEDHGRPILNTAFNYVHFHQLAHVLSLPGVRLVDFQTWEETDFRLLVNAVTEPDGSGMWLRVDGDGTTFTAEQAGLYADAWLSVLHRMTEQPHGEPDLSFLAARPVLADVTEHPTVVARFAEQAARTPDATALVMGEERWSYARLAEAAGYVARRLRGLGAPVGARIGIAMDRAPRTVAVILGVFQAGCAVVPLDVGYPVLRLATMLKQARLFRVVADAAYAHIAGDPALLLAAESVTEPPAGGQAGPPPTGPAADSAVAYVLFTSGSTGTPKGVTMPHRSLAGLVAWQIGALSAAPGGVTLQYAPLSFDVSFQEIFSTLCSGGTLCLVGDAERRDMSALLRLLDQEHVERIFLPYVALQQLAETADTLGVTPRALRVLISSGEQLRVTREIRRLCAALPGAVLENQYGPTETHVATAFTMTEDPAAFPALPPIGHPIDGAEVHVLDDRLRPVPAGACGEIYLGGACLADGYENRPDLTKERFLPHPFADGNRTLYRTGDIGMVLPGGAVVYAGRADEQVKVRGFRVEPAEVELALTGLAKRLGGLRDAAVVARTRENGETFLAAFLVGEGTDEDLAGIRRRLRATLPDHMVPSHLQWVGHLPLTPSGKRDDAALRRAPLVLPARSSGTGPRDAYEQTLTEMLADVLCLDAVGVQDHFFDLGGTSLTAMRLVARIEHRYGTSIPLGDFIATPTVAGLATRLRAGGARPSYDPVVRLRRQGTRAPVFMVHPMGGNVLCYVRLAQHLPDDQPLIALQADTAHPGTPPLGSVEALADRYVRALRTVQPHGPYTVGGWSFGGFVAFEIARQLRAAGEEVARLLLLDTTALGQGPRVQHRDEDLLEWFFRELSPLREGDESPARTIPDGLGLLEEKFAFLARLSTERGFLPAGGSASLIRRLFDVYRSNWQAALAYRPLIEDQDLTLIRAADPLPGVLTPMHSALDSRHQDPDNGWSSMTSGRIDVVVVPGDHLTIMEEPYVARVASTVADLIADGQARRTGER